MGANSKFPRGSEWRQWDLHIHTPASFEWSGEKFGADTAKNASLIDAMINAINDAQPAVFALQDYFTFDGWFKLKNRRALKNTPTLKKTVFPGIELRLCAPIKGRLNAHVIFSDETKDQYLHDFMSRLKLEITEAPLSRSALIDYARNVTEDKLRQHGFKKSDVMADESTALRAGYVVAEINVDSYKEAIRKVPEQLAVGFMPFSTNDGLESVDWAKHYAYTLGLFTSSPIFETRKVDQWAAFAGIETMTNKAWIKSFQDSLNNIPCLAVSGSDAHAYAGSGSNDDRGYGDFPSGKKTWIKADPTWMGLLHAIKAPANRSFIGEMPPKAELVNKNKPFYIAQVGISKVAGSSLTDVWLDGCQVPLNADLVAIIGNKGSGKSALADIVALLGNSQQHAYFSFLRKDRFRGKNGEPARQFIGTLQWLTGAPGSMALSENPTPEKVELVRYIPQGRFEVLCNDHVAGKSDAFEKELRAVIFSHIPASVRLEALDFEQLIEDQERNFRASLSELRKSLSQIDAQIVSLEDQLHPNVVKNLEDQIRLKRLQLDEHQRAKPKEVAAPTESLTPEQQEATVRLSKIADEIAEKERTLQENGANQEQLGRRVRAVKNVGERLNILTNQFNEFSTAVEQDLVVAQLTLGDVASLKVDRAKLQQVSVAAAVEIEKLKTDAAALGKTIQVFKTEQQSLAAKLNEPQQRHQKYLEDLKAWQLALAAIKGAPTLPDTLNGLENRLAQIKALPDQLAQQELRRFEVVKRIFDVLSEQRDARAALFAPVQELTENNSLIRDEYKLKFQANLQGSPDVIADRLFSMVKQTTGELRGDDKSLGAVRQRFDRHVFNDGDDTAEFAEELHQLVVDASRAPDGEAPGIRVALRKDIDPVDVYDYIFGLQYLEPKYTLLFQDTEIERLSPGQRGALLLIFYLLVDKGRNPIVLDQPEENLDNETIVSLLVPVINEAKKSRQIIMVTHNPNLAVVCDAEQIVHATFDRRNGAKISYESGSLEDGTLNRAVVDVLEGTKKAFDIRERTYHKQEIV